MSTVFIKKSVKIIAFALSLLVIAFACLYAKLIHEAVQVTTEKKFYYVVADDLHLQASTQETLLKGGAGYLLETKTGDYAAYQVYFSKTNAENVCKNLNAPSKIVAVTVKNGYLKTEKEKARQVKNAFSCLDDCIEVLNGEIVRLENGATQESSRRVLESLTRQCNYLSKAYSALLPEHAKLMKTMEEGLTASTEGIIYTKNLRYILCQTCFEYARLSEEYAL